MATTKKQKKAVEAKAPVKEQKKVETSAALKEQTKPETKNSAKEQTKPKAEKPELVNIFSTTYGYWRYFIKNILAEGGIVKFRFVKDEGSYNGKMAVAKAEAEKAKKVLAGYKAKHPDEKEMWK